MKFPAFAKYVATSFMSVASQSKGLKWL